MMFDIPRISGNVEPGVYKATLLGVTVREGGKFTSPQNPQGKYRVWDWLIDVDGEGVPFSDFSSVNNGPQTVSYQRLTALLGEEPKAGKSYEAPTGKTVLVTVASDGKYSKIEEVKPYSEDAALPR